MNDTIALVLDRSFGDRIESLLARVRAVWAVDSDENRRFADRATMLFAREDSAEQWLLNHLDSVDQHHNRYAEDPPYRALDVYGCAPTAAVAAHLPAFDFVRFEARPWGFRAWKR